MKTVGEILKEARLQKGITLEEAQEITKIRKEFLQALEENNFSQLPSYISARGFLKNYTEFLGLSPKSILAIFRRDFNYFEPEKELNPGGDKQKFELDPKKIFWLSMVIFFFGLFAWLGYQYFSYKGPPSLKIIFPKEGQQFVNEERIEVIGKTQPEATVTVNNIPVFLSSEGEFRCQIDLFRGENKIIVIAKNRRGKVNKLERKVYLLDKNEEIPDTK